MPGLFESELFANSIAAGDAFTRSAILRSLEKLTVMVSPRRAAVPIRRDDWSRDTVNAMRLKPVLDVSSLPMKNRMSESWSFCETSNMVLSPLPAYRRCSDRSSPQRFATSTRILETKIAYAERSHIWDSLTVLVEDPFVPGFHLRLAFGERPSKLNVPVFRPCCVHSVYGLVDSSMRYISAC